MNQEYIDLERAATDPEYRRVAIGILKWIDASPREALTALGDAAPARPAENAAHNQPGAALAPREPVSVRHLIGEGQARPGARHASKLVLVLALALALTGASACSNLTHQQERALSGGAIGLAGGAALTALAGGSVLAGALVGGAAGAAIGAFTNVADSPKATGTAPSN